MKTDNNQKIKIIVASHKKYRMPEEDMYVPVQVGAKGRKDIGMLRDDSGDNISEKNPIIVNLQDCTGHGRMRLMMSLEWYITEDSL